MKLITEKRFFSLERLNEENKIIRILDNDTLLKKIDVDLLPIIRALLDFKIDKLGLPMDIYRVVFSPCFLYSMPYFSSFATLDNFKNIENKFSDKEILIFYKNIIEKVEEMHKKGLASGDIYASNIMIDENLDYRFIDFDYASTEKIDGYMLCCGPLFLDNYNKKVLDSNYSVISQVELSDKMNLWNMILNCMLLGNFYNFRYIDRPYDFSAFNMPVTVEKKLSDIFNLVELPKTDDYFLEELDALIKSDYKLPYRKKK